MKKSQEILDFLVENGVEIKVDVQGKGTKAILVLPGIGMSSVFFKSKLSELAKDYKIFYCSIVCHLSYDSQQFVEQWNKLLLALEDEYLIKEWNSRPVRGYQGRRV